ncbi:hypothetical protein [Actinomadura alba]|uniref:Uncharacterized protein n=1 Tax=Actinomadura alba TaxID=406431 RepID=A0ABR7LZJ2_9ACTN|nr:hypothetical protein [Actinomadura alba]MBC6469917.1 hypothetical protein [Actinomadura alba]
MNEAGEETWEQIRATRWRPPAHAAADAARRETYSAALEQAQQLFRAATVGGPETRP